MNLLIKKYQPKTLKEVLGQDLALNRLKTIFKNKVILLYGPIGTGKTSAVYALSNDLNYEILEINASDYRNKEQIENIIGKAVEQQSLFKKSKIILIDEIDGISGQKDRGGIQSILKIIDKTRQPIILIGNDIWDTKFKELRRKCELIQFDEIKDSIIFKILNDICKKEKIKFKEEILRKLSSNVKGDVRAAINDLQSLIIKKKLLNLDLDKRDEKENILNILKTIFKNKDINKSLDSLSNNDLGLDEIFLWLEENIPKEYSNEDLIDAYDKLSKADVFRGRILRWQYWRFLLYQKLLMGGITLSKNKNCRFTNYKRSSRILKIWIANRKNSQKIELAKDLAKKNHLSTKKMLKEMPYIKNILANN